MFRTLPPTAAPISLRDLFLGATSSFSNNGADSRFEDQIRKYFNVKHVFLMLSGKAALYFALKAMRQISKREEVIIPAYSSFCLASAVARSGLSVKLCDIDPETLDFDLERLNSTITEKTLAVIPVHNYGLVCNLKEIKKLALEKGSYVVEDAAQAAGALFEDRTVGTIGDVGILSLGRGKNVCALGGGVILTDDDVLAASIGETLKGYPKAPMSSNFRTFVAGFGLSLFLNPERYVLPSHLPFLDLGANIFDPNFKVGRLPNLNTEVGQKTFSNVDHLNDIRIHNAQSLRKTLGGNTALKMPEPKGDGKSVYLRFPILFQNKEMREKVFVQLNRKRLGASTSYPTPLNQIPGFRKYLSGDDDFPGAQYVSDRILTLPTHPYVTDDDIKKIVSVINGLVSGKR
jgi:dTDP-4-amino-4,6-dideoxygalactose transaminase